MSKDKADKYIRELAAMKPILVESMLPAGERVSTGEMPIAVTFVKYAYTAGKTGAPARLCADRENARRQPLRRHEQ